MNDRKRLRQTPDEYTRFILACKLIARETGNHFDTIYELAVLSKIHAGPFYGQVQQKMFAMTKSNLPIK